MEHPILESQPENGNYMNRRETRRQERTMAQAAAKLRWCGKSGEARYARGKIINCSETGLCIELTEPIRTCSYVVLDAPEIKRADWGGAVRHCEQKGLKFRIGLELTTGCR